MTGLLTWNGIPPRIVGSLTEQEQQSVIAYATSDGREDKYLKDEDVAESLHPFRNIALGTANQFVKWGASFDDESYITMDSRYLKIGETNFQRDLNLHSDSRRGMKQLREKNKTTLRLIAVSDTTSQFIDLTQEEDIQPLLECHRILYGPTYESTLLTLAHSKGQVLKPRPWDVVLCDAITPHLPEGVDSPHRRIVQSAWIEMTLPSNWQERVKSGDAPRL